jgi:protein-disulfide isomerase
MQRASLSLLFLFILFVGCGGGSPSTSNLVVIPTAVRITDDTPGGETATSDVLEPSFGAWNDDDASVPVSSLDPSWGRRDALVTIVEFSDFQCPYCSRAKTTLDELRTGYRADELRLVFKHLPLAFHPNAKPSAEAAQGVFATKGAEAFFRFHDLAFANQKDLGRDSYLTWAENGGVIDLAAYERGLDDHRWSAKVDADAALAKRVGANGTPAFYINGVELSGAQPLEKFKEVVDAELAKATAKITRGTPRSRIYSVMSQENKKTQPAATADDDDTDDTTTVFKIPVGNEPARGAKTALVTIVEFSDFQCPYCAKVESTLTALSLKYGSALRLVWRNEPLPFHPRAMPAANLAMEARAQKGDAAFWSAHDELFANQKNLDDATLDAIAQRIGLDVAKARAAVQASKHRAAIEADMDVAEDFQASGTPHFFINGRRLVGAQPQEKFERIIDDELKKARALIAKGTPAASIYTELTKGGKGPPALEKKAVAPSTTSPAKGNLTAKVTIQEFADFQCPFCGRAEQTIAEVMKTYGTRVRLQWRDLPLPMHTNAPLAAQAGREAMKQKGSTAFWQIHDMMLGNQQDLSRATLDGYAQKIGLDMTKWKGALDSGVHQKAIDAEAAIANGAGISGTPAFVVNGYFISGAQPMAKFRKVIERALAEAK